LSHWAIEPSGNSAIRLQCAPANPTATVIVKGSKARLIPAYAYYPGSQPTAYIADSATDNNQAAVQSEQRPTGIYQFGNPGDLFKFQAKLTGEDVVLDISAVKWLKLAKANSRSSDTFSSVRLQIWHEPRSRRSTQSDTASIITAGTALSGPIREKVVANSSRLMIFLGRTEGYITVFSKRPCSTTNACYIDS
jgi:hypothetical protein